MFGKKLVFVIFVLLMASLISFNVSSQEMSPVKLTMLNGGSGGGTWGLTAQGISECIRKTAPGSITTLLPGSSFGNITRVSKGEADMGFTFINNIVDASLAREGFDEQIILKVIGSPISTVAQFIVMKSLGIDSFQKIKDQQTPIRISVHQRGSGNEQYSRRILDEYGITYDDIESWGGKVVFANEGDSLQLIADGQLDAFCAGGEPPKAGIVNLASSRKLTLISIDEDVIASMAEKYGYTPRTIPSGKYNFYNEDYKTFAASVVLAVPVDMPNETAYTVAKALYENREYLGTVHSNIKVKIVDNPKGLIDGIPKDLFHPGALDYFIEAGLID